MDWLQPVGRPVSCDRVCRENAYALVCWNDRKAGNDVYRVSTRHPEGRIVEQCQLRVRKTRVKSFLFPPLATDFLPNTKRAPKKHGDTMSWDEAKMLESSRSPT